MVYSDCQFKFNGFWIMWIIVLPAPDQVQPVIHSPPHQDIYNPYDLAVDIYGRRLYWTDSQDNTISVSQLDGTPIGVVIKEAHQKPRALALSVFHG